MVPGQGAYREGGTSGETGSYGDTSLVRKAKPAAGAREKIGGSRVASFHIYPVVANRLRFLLRDIVASENHRPRGATTTQKSH